MYKNTVLNTAINTALALPRHTLWATTAVIATFSLDAGLAVVGDGFSVTMGTPAVHAVAGDFVNDNAENGDGAIAAAAGPPAIVKGHFASAVATIDGIPAKGLGPYPALDADHPKIHRVDGGNYEKQKAEAADAAALALVKDGDDTGLTDPVTYATEIFTSGNPIIPSDTADSHTYQVVKYTVSGNITRNFKLMFELSGGATFSGTPYIGISNAAVSAGPGALGCVAGSSLPYTVMVDSDNPAGTLAVGASCAIMDGTNIYLAFKLTNVAATLKAGGNIDMTAKITGTGADANNPAIPLNPTRTITVATSIPAAKAEIIPELGKLGHIFVSTADNNTLFIDKSPSSLIGGDSPFISDELVQIGYVKITSKYGANATAKKFLSLGQTGDKGTLSITNGQFAASLCGGKKGCAYIDAGGPIEATPITDQYVASWALTDSQLKNISDVSAVAGSKGAPIKIKVDRTTTINDIDVEKGQAPVSEMSVTLAGQTAPVTVGPVDLRRIPRDGKTCWVYNIPPPDGNLDLLSVRVTNDTPRAGVLTGTLYPQEGGDTPDFMNVNLLTAIAGDATDTRNEVIELVTDSTGASVPALKGKATIRFSADDIAKAGGVASWTAERKVLKIVSQISEMEVMSLLRYGVDATKQPQSNVSTGVTGNSCE